MGFERLNIDHGYIKIDEKVLHKDIDFPESLGIIIENPSFFSYYTGFENLKFLSNIGSYLIFYRNSLWYNEYFNAFNNSIWLGNKS